MTFTAIQKEALQLLSGEASDVLLYGGARSGKSLVICAWMIRMATRHPGSWWLIARLRFNHARSSIWQQTFIPLLKSQVPRQFWDENKSDVLVNFVNGSTVYLGGFDERERIEKLLGHEYLGIYLNEVSQISWQATELAHTRLAQKIGEVKPKAIYDCNPPAPNHWSHRYFIDHKHPVTEKPLREKVGHLLMNPEHNRVNLPNGYIENTLGSLAGPARARFLLGEWARPAGTIFEDFTAENITKEIPDCERYVVGVDLVTYAAVLVGLQRRRKKGRSTWYAYVIDEWGRIGGIAAEANEAIIARWGTYGYQAILDHNLGKAGIREFAQSRLAVKGPGSVEAGIALLQRMFRNGELLVHPKCTTLRYELDNYHRDEFGQIIAEDDHHIAGLRMALYTTLGARREIEVY